MFRSDRLGIVSIFVTSFAACAPIDIKPETKSFADALTTATAPLEAGYAARAAAEEKAARDGAAGQLQEVYRQPDGCTAFAIDLGSASLEECKLTPLVTAPSVPGTAKYALEGVAALRAYAGALDALSSSTAPSDVQKSFGELLAALSEISAVSPSLKAFGSQIGKVSQPATDLAGRLAEARRMGLIRELVRRADEPVSSVLSNLIADRAEADGVLDSYAALEAAFDEMSAARSASDVARYRVAVAGYENAMSAFHATAAQSDAGRLLMVKAAQAALLRRVKEPSDPEDLVAFIETLKTLTDALRPEDGS